MIERFEIKERIDLFHLPLAERDRIILMAKQRVRERIAAAIADVLISVSTISRDLIEIECSLILADEVGIDHEVRLRNGMIRRVPSPNTIDTW
jgi:hypothetical protein